MGKSAHFPADHCLQPLSPAAKVLQLGAQAAEVAPHNWAPRKGRRQLVASLWTCGSCLQQTATGRPAAARDCPRGALDEPQESKQEASHKLAVVGGKQAASLSLALLVWLGQKREARSVRPAGHRRAARCQLIMSAR